MIYLTIITCAGLLVIGLVIISIVLHSIIEIISTMVYDFSESRMAKRVEEYESIGKMFSQMVYGPGQVPVKSAEEIMQRIKDEVDVSEEGNEDVPFPLHETDDEFLRWIPNTEQELVLMDLPEHEEDDVFMNSGESNAN